MLISTVILGEMHFLLQDDTMMPWWDEASLASAAARSASRCPREAQWHSQGLNLRLSLQELQVLQQTRFVYGPPEPW